MSPLTLDSPADERLHRYRCHVESGDWSDWSPLSDIWPTLGGEACNWIERHCVFGDGERFGELAELLPEWRSAIFEWFEFEPGPDGQFRRWRYKRGLLGWPKGCGKTQVLAWLAVLCAFGPAPFAPRSAHVRIAAASFDQAKELFAAVQVCCGGQDDIYPDFPLSGLFYVQDAQVVRKDSVPGRIERIAAAAGTSDGAKPTLFIADELHEWTGNKERVHFVNSNGVAKRVDARELNISTAGVRGSIPAKPTDSLLWRMYVAGLELLSKPDPRSRFLFRWRAAWQEGDQEPNLDDPAELEAALRHAGGSACDRLFALADRVERYSSPELPRADFSRYFLNVWVRQAADSWLADRPGAWDDCREAGACIPDGAQGVVLGIDAALRGDSFAVAAVWPRPDGRLVWSGRVWRSAKGRIDFVEVRSHIAACTRRWRVRAMVYDPRLVEFMVRELEEDLGVPAVEVPQSVERRSKMDLYAYELIVSGRVVHDGDPDLREHALSAVWRESERGRVLSKSRSGSPIDLLIACDMASWEATEAEPPVLDPLLMVR
ncbi:MAG: terminase TerL endonuclease subunit [Acidimicrobiales bacterium]